jgi:demethylspheroidene O-methyltransferase
VPAAAAAAYSQVMTASQPLVGAVVLDAWPLARYRQLLDVGGGEGAFLRAAAASAPALQLALLELPAVADRAAAAFDAAGLGARLTIHRGNFLTDPLPTGADCISLIRVCFDHDDGAVLRLLQQVHVALPPGGTVLIAEPMAGLPGAKRVGVYFSLYLLAMRSGRPRTPAEFARLLRTAGFGTVRSVPTAAPIQTGLMVAFK